MLFLVNKTDQRVFEKIKWLGGDDEKLMLLTGDAVCYAEEAWADTLEALDVDELFAAKDAVEARNLKVSDDCELLDYPQIVDLLFSGEKVVSI